VKERTSRITYGHNGVLSSICGFRFVGLFYCCIKTIPGLAFFSLTQIRDDLVTTIIDTGRPEVLFGVPFKTPDLRVKCTQISRPLRRFTNHSQGISSYLLQQGQFSAGDQFIIEFVLSKIDTAAACGCFPGTGVISR